MRCELSQEERTFIESTWHKVQAKLFVSSDRIGTAIPYIASNHRYTDVAKQNITWWTNGFWGGILWQMYSATRKEKYLRLARGVESRLDDAFTVPEKLDHDVGFMWLNTAVADFKVTGDTEAKRRGLYAAEILATRYNPAGKYLLAWNGQEKQGQIIVDCFMNLPLLFWASEQTHDERYAQIAIAHAQTATKFLVRADGSINHIAVFDPQTGIFEKNLGGQGYEEGSAWSRGQAWGIYGLSLAYRETKDEYFLNAAKQVANYFVANVAQTGNVSRIDFRAPNQPIYQDTTATTIAICGLLELIKYLPINQCAMYRSAAFEMFVAITRDYCDFQIANDELVTYGSAKYHRESDREVPIIYGDAFYIEALLRFLNQDLTIY